MMKKISLVLFIVFSVFFFDIGVLEAKKAEVDGNVKGLPAQGLYDDSDPSTAESRSRLDRMAQAGFKLVLNYGVFDYDVEDIISYADHAARVGMKVIWDMSSRPYRDGTFDRDYIRERVEAVKTHSATWGYYIADEPDENEHRQVKALSDYVHNLDPAHPRFLVHYYQSADPTVLLRPHVDAADVIGLDIYPLAVGDEPSEDVGESSKAGQEFADKNSKQWAIVLQSFDAAQYPEKLPDGYAGWPDKKRMLKERNLALKNSHPAFIFWYSYFDILRSSDPAGHWADLVAAAFSPAPFGPIIKANGQTNSITVGASDTVTITVEMNASTHPADVSFDWWAIASANLSIYWYMNSALQWAAASFTGSNYTVFHPVYQGPLFNLSSTTVLSGITLPPGTYDFWFAIDYPMDGILNPAGTILYDKVTLIVQE